MKRYLVITQICLKRLLKQPLYLLSCAALFIVCILIFGFDDTKVQGIKAAVYLEDGSLDELIRNLNSQKGTLEFIRIATEEELYTQVQAGNVECGYVIPDTYETDGVTEYCRENSISSRLIREVLFSYLFVDSSSRQYTQYKKELGMEKEKINKTYHTFMVEYKGKAPDALLQETAAGGNGFSLRGIVTVFVMAGMMCGVIKAATDYEKRRFECLRERKYLGFCTLFLPALIMGICGLIVIYHSGEWTYAAKELSAMLYYILMLYLLGWLMLKICKKSTVLMGAVPFLLLCSVLFAKIGFDVEYWVPAARVIGKVFPVSYYLSFFS